MEIKHKGKTYKMDVDKAIEKGFLVEDKPALRKIGQLYQNRNTKEIYLVCCVDNNKVNLICLSGRYLGNRYKSLAVTVKDIYSITKQEWDKLDPDNDLDFAKELGELVSSQLYSLAQ